MQKIRKILRAVSEKTALPTNYYQQYRSYRASLMPIQPHCINASFAEHIQKIKIKNTLNNWTGTQMKMKQRIGYYYS